MLSFLILSALSVLLVFAYMGLGYFSWFASAVLLFFAWLYSGVESPLLFFITMLSFIGMATFFGLPILRRHFVSKPIMFAMSKLMPAISKTEEVALKAGTVWWDGELFSGKPDWPKLLNFKINPLSEKEKAFLDGPAESLCKMLDEWQINQDRDLSSEVWDYLKDNKFFGMIIPPEFEGLGFSAAAHSAVVTKIASKSVAAAVTVMVPNSLGPAELIMHYGSDEQKKYYLPRLAKGQEIPCFALTESNAGSDAASGQSRGTICMGMWEGKEVLGIRITFNKRYITLAPVATIIGLSIHLYDPDQLIGEEHDIGITCVLLPSKVNGVKTGRYHDPMGVPFANGPVEGKDVFVPMDFIIGGKDFAGQGWKMLMETLSTGRGISLPSLSVGAVELTTRVTSAYTAVREQFGMPIGNFEGIRERLARIAGHSYFMNAVRNLTCGAVDAGERPSVISAIAKTYLTEGMRTTINDGMDILAGASICKGPGNVFSTPYASIDAGP